MSQTIYVVFRLNSLGLLKLAWFGPSAKLGLPLVPSLSKGGIECPKQGAPPLTFLDKWRLRKLRSYRYRAVSEPRSQGFRTVLGTLGWWMLFFIKPFTVHATSAVFREQAVMAQPLVPDGKKRRLRAGRQSFLAGEPAGGVGVGAAWSVMKGRGDKAHVTLLDLGCAAHDQLPDVIGLPAGPPSNVTCCSHGVAVLGVMGATKRRGQRTRAAGISHRAQFEYCEVSQKKQPGVEPQTQNLSVVESTIYDHLVRIGCSGRPGQILVLPLEVTTKDGFSLPVEALGDVREAIRFVIGRGMHVIQSAGNGAQDLGRHISRCADSGSIVVSSGSAYAPARVWNSNHGSRVDIHSWGHDVATLSLTLANVGSPHVVSSYTDSFGATSAATAITAGVVAALVSTLDYHRDVAKAQLGYYRQQGEWDSAERACRQVVLLQRWSRPRRLRKLLRSTAYWQTPGIGGRPSLPRILAFLTERGIRFYSAASSSRGLAPFGGRPWRSDGY